MSLNLSNYKTVLSVSQQTHTPEQQESMCKMGSSLVVPAQSGIHGT